MVRYKCKFLITPDLLRVKDNKLTQNAKILFWCKMMYNILSSEKISLSNQKRVDGIIKAGPHCLHVDVYMSTATCRQRHVDVYM